MDTYYCFNEMFLKSELEFAKLPTLVESFEAEQRLALKEKSPALGAGDGIA
jgi:hypothetical protein